jgi:hypothetical protein
MRAFAPLFVALTVAVAAASDARRASGQAREPLLHEFLPPDVEEDVTLGSTTRSGQLPAVIRTPSGPITPPDVLTGPEPRRAYHGGDASVAPTHPDRDTRRPSVLHYDDPFTPALTPFKRLYAYDAVHADYGWHVRDARLVPVPIGGAPRDGDDRFFADLAVVIEPGRAVRIPTVGPEARALRLLASPNQQLTLLRDSAGNWFVRGDRPGRTRVVADIAITRDSFASEFADVAWRELPAFPAPPGEQRSAFARVAQAIGISRTMSPREVVTTMVAYFRSFAASNEPPNEHGDVYLDLALSRKGVCRHRAFAFFVTALHVGIPARMIHNEAHAWVEVSDGRLWRRVDLGGAAVDLDDDREIDRPPHMPPPDQFPWPSGRDSGSDLAHRRRTAALDTQQARTAASGEPRAPADPSSPEPAAPPSGRPETRLVVDGVDHDVFRGLPMRVRGRATAGGEPCAHLRVDVLVRARGEAAERRVGSLSTDERGTYDGAVVMPRALPLGDHELVLATAGHARCGPGRVQ